MDEPNEYEISAMNQAGDVAGQYIDTIGRTDVATYTSEEWRGFVAAVCGAYVVHPGTGRPYDWPEDNPLDVPLENLPAVTESQVMAWLDQAYALIPAEMKPRTLIGDSVPADVWRGPSDPRGTYEAIRSALAHIPNDDLDATSWITMGAAIKAALGEEGRDLWLDWSKSSGKSGTSGKSDTAERRWATLRPHSIGAGSIYTLAIARGWNPPPEVIVAPSTPTRRTRRGSISISPASASTAPPRPPPSGRRWKGAR